jgi:hypothetical protein
MSRRFGSCSQERSPTGAVAQADPRFLLRKLPTVLSSNEVAHVLTATTCTTYRAALAVAYGVGLRVSLKLNLIRNNQNVVQPRLPPSTALGLKCVRNSIRTRQAASISFAVARSSGW